MYNDLLTFLESWGDTILCDTNSPDDDYSDYLSIGEKITSLRKNEVSLYQFNENSVYEVGYSGMNTTPKLHRYFCERLAKKIVRPCLPHRVDEIINLILPEYQPSITYLDNPSCINGVFNNLNHSVMVTIENDGTKLTAYTSLDDKLSPAYHWGRIKRSGELIVDPGFYFAELIILSEIKKELQKIKSLSVEERAENIFYANLVNECKALTKCSLVPAKSLSGKYTDKIISSILSFGGCIFTEEINTLKAAQKYEHADSSKRPLSHYSSLLFYMVSYFDIPIFLLQAEKSTPYFSILKNFFRNLVNEYQSDKNTAKYNKAISSDYASAYQTKKNIPKNILHAMSTSKFNEHFGYVEFDADCDLEKISLIEKEFLALTKIFNQDRLNEYSIRFRKLGKHRAAGLYFPSLGCLCVDIDSPNSLGHEYFHLLDYKNNCLSKRYSFQSIIQLYTCLIEEEVKKSDKLKQWNGNTKYNRDYYLEPTEIFARCGEMYLTHIKQVSNSLVNPDYNGFAYPNNADLLYLIDNYFSKVLPEISYQKEVA